MGFITSFLIIAFFGFWVYHLYHTWALPRGHEAFVAWYAFVVVAGFMIFDFLMYVGLFNTTLIPLLNLIPWVNGGIVDGRDFLWNSGILIGIDFGIVPTQNMDMIAYLILISYPMWFKWFSNGSRMLWGGNEPHQCGQWYLFEPTKKPKGDEKVAVTPKET